MSETDEFFSTPETEARLDLIRHLIENSELVPLVRGATGIGKSLLASRLQSTAPRNWAVCHFSADSMLQPERLLAHVARCNGLPDAKGENIRRLVERFEALRKRGTVPVLLIDDAEKLPPTSLITLLRLYERQVAGAPLLSLVLFANEQIDMLLSTPQLQIMSPQSIQVIDLPPLTREEADGYMSYLLKSEGLDPRLAIEPGRMNRIYRETGGAPGPMGVRILEAFGEGGESKGSSGHFWERRSLVWGGVPLVAVVVLLLIFQGPINRLFSSGPEVGDGTVATTDTVRVEVLPVPQRRPSRADETPAVADAPVVGRAPPASAPPPADQPVEMPAPVERLVDDGRPTPTSVTVAASSEPPPAGDGETVVPASSGTKSTGEAGEPAPMAAEPALPEEKQAEINVSAVSERTPTNVSAPPEVAEETPETVAKSAKESALPKPESKTAPATSSLLRDSEWLAARPAGAYTVQLLAVENVESVQQVVEKHGLGEAAFTVRTERKGRPWYPLLWGQYPNRPAALEAIKRLPAPLRAGGAWARSFASLQQ